MSDHYYKNVLVRFMLTKFAQRFPLTNNRWTRRFVGWYWQFGPGPWKWREGWAAVAYHFGPAKPPTRKEMRRLRESLTARSGLSG